MKHRSTTHARRSRILASAVGASVALQCAVHAHAADAEPASNVISEIIVTANRREETLQDVPLALTALTAPALERFSVNSLDDVQTLTPSLNFGGRSTVRPQMSIRGVGTEQFTNAVDSPIGVFIDDVPIPRFSSFYAPFTDIERVEVLRGPQGTLYGRNTIAGALNIITKAPANALEAAVELGAGSYNERSAKASASGPIIDDRLLYRVAAFGVERDGYIDNLGNGATASGDDTRGALAKFRLLTENDWTLDLTFDYGRTDTPGEASEPSDPNQPQFFPAPGVRYRLGPTENPYTYYSDIASRVFREQYGAAARAAFEGDSIDFVSVSAYRDSRTRTVHDNDGSDLNIMIQREAEASESFSQEFRLLSKSGGAFTFDDRVQWLLGAFILRERSERQSQFDFGSDSLFTFLAANSTNPANRAAAADGMISDRVENQIDTLSYAAFARGTIDVTDRLALTLGARYSVDEKEAVFDLYTDVPGVPTILANTTGIRPQDDWSSFDGEATLHYQWNPDLLTYARFATGYRSGSFQAVPTSAAAAEVIADPEDLEMLEIGLKSTLLAGKMIANVAAFDYDYTNFQVTQLAPLSTGGAQSVIRNAPGVNIRGAELETQLQITKAWRFSASYSYIDAEYESFLAPVAGVGNTDIGGQPLPRAPRYQAIATTDYVLPLGDFDLTLAANVLWQGKTYLLDGGDLLLPAVRPNPNIEDPYSIVNVNVRIENARRGYYVDLYGKNVGDTVYRVGANVIGGTPSLDYWGPPAMYGVRFGWRL